MSECPWQRAGRPAFIYQLRMMHHLQAQPAGEVGWSMLQGTHCPCMIDTIVEVELSTHQWDDLWINEAEHEHDFEAPARHTC